MNKEEFDKQLEYNDFAIGDEFWLEGIEFEVKNKLKNLPIK